MVTARIKRVIETAKLLKKGKTIEEVANNLNLSVNTIMQYQKEIETSNILSKKVKKFNWRWIVDIILFAIAIFSIWFAYYLSNPIDLEIWHNISIEEGRLYIYGKNNDFFRSTGDIELYRMEVNPEKPHMQLRGNETLKRKKSRMLFSLLIEINESEEFLLSEDFYKPFSIPAVKTYFIMDKESISYKITCDNCRKQGIIKRVPDYGGIDIRIAVGRSLPVMGKIPLYSWKEFDLEDLYE